MGRQHSDTSVTSAAPTAAAPAEPTALVRRLVESVCRAFVGKEPVVECAVLTLVAGGHLLIEDVPGLGKTLLAKALAKSISAEFKRIQFTADLLPSDITGVTTYSPESQRFAFHPGPVFANILLGDEINRATPRTQSSLLEAMEEDRVTVDGEAHPLPPPFFVMATQNPVELEGTYPLPFAQMDRFMVRLGIGYLDREAEVLMVQAQRAADPLDLVRPVMDCRDVCRVQAAARQVTIEESLVGYIVDLVRATRATDSLEYGASPRASLDLQSFAQASALLAGRGYVLPDDVKQAARLLLPHRLIVRRGTRSVSVNARTVIDHVVDAVPVPL